MSYFYLVALLPLLLLLVGKRSKHSRRPPGPRGLPFIGNLHQIDYSAPHKHLHQLAKTYGPFMSLQLGSVPTLVFSSAKMAKEVMKTHDLSFASRPHLLGQQKLSYNGIEMVFSPYNETWREVRKIGVLHLFSMKRVQSFRSAREEEVALMIEKIRHLADSSKVVNLSELTMSLTSNLTCKIAFGKRCDDEIEGRSRFHGLLNETQAMFGMFFVSDYFPLFGWMDKVSGLCARLEKNFKEMDSFYQELIDDHLSGNRVQSTQDDFIDILLQIRKNELTPFELTFDHIKAILMNVFVAGTDTGAATTVWVMTALMQHPNVMKKVQEEVQQVVGNKGLVTEDDIQNLPYLSAVIKETFRLYPTVPLLVPRETIDKCVIDGYEIQPKTLVFVNSWAVGRDPEAWENPEEFIPERFLDSDIDFRGQHFELIPFGAGRRGCPGINMGMATVEITLSNLLYSFDWGLPAGMKREGIDFDALPGIAMHKKNHLCLIAANYSFV